MRSDPGRLRVVDGAPAELAARVPPGPERLRSDGRSADPLQDADDDYPSPGRFVREQRVRRGWSLEQLAAATKVPRSSLGALEDDRYEALPGPVFVKGFFKCCARALELDAGVVLDLLYERERALARDARRKPVATGLPRATGAGATAVPPPRGARSESSPAATSREPAASSRAEPPAGTAHRVPASAPPDAAAVDVATFGAREVDAATSAADASTVALFEPEAEPGDDPGASASDRRRRRSGESRRARKAKARAAALSAASGTHRVADGAEPAASGAVGELVATRSSLPSDARTLGLTVDSGDADLQPSAADVQVPAVADDRGGEPASVGAVATARGAATTGWRALWTPWGWAGIAVPRARASAADLPAVGPARRPVQARTAGASSTAGRGLRQDDWRSASTSIPIAQGAFGRAREAERRFEAGLWQSIRQGAALPSLLLWLAVALFVGVVAFAAFSFGTFEGRVPTRAAPSAS